MKKKIAMALILTLILTAFGGCGSNNNAEKSTTQNQEDTQNQANTQESAGTEIAYTGEPVTVVLSFLAFSMPSAEGEAAVEAAINEITREKIGVEVDLLPLDGGSYTQQIPLMLAGGEQVDAFSMLGMSYSTMVNSGYTLDLEENDLIQTYGQGIIEEVGAYLDGCRIGGTLYGLPQNRDLASPNGYMIANEYLDNIGYEYDAENVNRITEEELEDIFARLHEAYPDKTVLVEQQLARVSVFNDYAGGDWYGVLMDPANSLELTDLYSSQEYMDYCLQHYGWNRSGYISADALTNQDSAISLVGAGRAMAYACGIKPGIISQESQNTGRALSAFQTEEEYVMASGGFTTMCWSINSNTDNADAVMRLLNEFYINPALTDLLSYGIEGTDYVVSEEGFYTYPEGTDGNVGYHPNVVVFMFNEFIAGVWEGNDIDVWKQTKEMNENATMSLAMGFTFDGSSVSAEYTALNNVYEEYRNQIEYGFLDPETGIPEMVSRMKAAGLDEYIAEKQKQLDEWAAAQ